VTERLRRTALIIWSTIGAVILVGVFLWLAAEIRIIWLPLVFAGGIVVVLEPIVRGLERAHIHRVIGSFVAYLIAAGILAAAGFLVVPPIREQAAEFGATVPDLYDRTLEFLQELGTRLGFDLGPAWTYERIQEWVQDPANREAIQSLIGGFGSGAGRLLRGVAEVVAVTVLAPILAFYLLLDLPRTRRMVTELTPARHRAEVQHVLRAVGKAVGGFVRGQLLVAFIVGLLSSLGLYLIDMPFWLIIGIAAGVLNLIPFVGPVVGGGLALVVGIFDGNLGKGLAAVAIFVAIQQLDNHVITPIVQRAQVHLSPLVIVLALIVGGSEAGLLGVLVAVPLVAVLRIVAGHLWRTRVLGESWKEAEEAMIVVPSPPERILTRRRRDAEQAGLFDVDEVGSEEASGDGPDRPSEG